MAEKPSKKRRHSKQKLLDDQLEKDGVLNPSLDEEMASHFQTFSQSQTEEESSAAEVIEENKQAVVLEGELKSRHRRRRRELSKLVSPKDDVRGELKTIKLDSRKKVEEMEHEDDLAKALAEVGAAAGETPAHDEDDGTVPMPFEIEETVTEAHLSPSRTTDPLEGELIVSTSQMEEESKPSPEKQRSTMRERMKSRLAKAKEEAETELELQEREDRKMRMKEGKGPRFEELGEDEMKTLKERKARLLKMKQERAKQQEVLSFMPTSEQAFDFFTRAWEPEPEEVAEAERQAKELAKVEVKAETGEPETEEERAAKEEDKGEESRLVEDEDYTEEGYGPIAIRKAYVEDPLKITKADNEMLYYPASTAVPAENKVVGEVEPRFLEDEGFYVGVKPYVADRNKNRMENRLLKEVESTKQPSKWFGEDGQLIILPNPLCDTPTRPAMQDEEVSVLETVFYKAILREFDSRYIDGAVDGGGFYQLDVDINSISFTHHHLFSKEHVLAKKLSLLYEEYLSRSKRNMTEFLVDKLAALKNSAFLLHNYIAKHKGEMAVADRDNYERRLRDYKSEIRQTRFLRDREELTDRMLLKSIIHTWKEIKMLREQQKYTNTPVKLQIRKQESTDKPGEVEQWNFEIEEEIKEEREHYEEEFMRKEAVFKDQMEKYEKQILAKEEAQKRITERNRQRKGSLSSKKSQETTKSKSVKEDEDESIEEENARDQDIIDEESLPKPDPPEVFDEKALRDQILTKAKTQKRQPGESKLFPEMSNSATVTPHDQCTRSEQQRRDDVTKCKLYVKIIFNGKEVSRTGPRPLLQDFSVSFGQIYNLKIVEWPESIKYEIYETSGFGSGRRLADIYAPIPESSVTSQSIVLENIEFSAFEKIAFDHEGVGSGVSFTFESVKPDSVVLMTSGVLNSSVAWAVGEDGLPLVPMDKFGANFQSALQIKKLDPFVAIGATGVANLEKLLRWFKESRLDPNDPNNKDIVYMLSGSDQNLLQPREFFRLEPMQQEFDFASKEDFEKNLRFKMIELRDDEHPLFKGYQMVPALEKEMPKDIFKEYEKKKRGDTQLQQAKGDFDQHRAQVEMYLQQIKDRVLTQYRFASHQKSLQDMVNEDLVPNVKMLFTAVLRMSEPRRPLKPLRKERKKVTATGIVGKEVKILINIIRATFIPVRKPSPSPAAGSQTARDTDGKPKVETFNELVCPFVEVMFQRSRVRTRRGEGPNPSFNEELELILKAPNDDYSPSSLQNIEDIIYINVFDEVTVDILEDERQRETNIHHRLDKKWLGSIKIPFSSVYFNNTIDGTFRLNTPPFLLGYSYGNQASSGGAAAEVESSIGQGSTFLSMFVTIEPSLALPEPFKERLSTNEEEELMRRADIWLMSVEKKFPNRIFRTTVMDTNGRNVFVTRYFRGIKPPPEVLACQNPDKAMELAAHYVSLIPFVSDTALFPGQCDIWSTCNQFMKMLCGDEEEHAVLLTNFFLGMGKKAWLVLGTAIPEGRTAYVLTEDSGKLLLWNARSGEKFSVYDNYCPLQIVGCVIDAENIWANIQQYEKPAQMNFNFSSSGWQPFYNKAFPSRGLASVQPAEIHYQRKDKKFDSLVVELQERIEQMLKNKIMEWRSRNITRWNRHCTQIMRKLLPVLEDNCGKPIDQSYLRDLEDSFRSYKVSGFPLNLAYLDMNSITEAVFSTGVHSQETSDVEFALAVYIHGYSNNVMSVWVYVASLIRLR